MKLLLSIVSPEEAKSVLKYQPDLLDIKNPKEGSLGAQFPWIIQDIVNVTNNTGIRCSVTLGDLPFKPGTASLAALGAAVCGADYIKAGMYGVSTYEEAKQIINTYEPFPLPEGAEGKIRDIVNDAEEHFGLPITKE
jgi:uncharacterized protein (UPF0264 family)